MPDTLTLLKCAPSLWLTKRWCSDGSIQPYSSAKHFTVSFRQVASIDDLSEMLFELERDPHTCIIRAAPKPGSTSPFRRLLEHCDDRPLHTILVEVDSYEPLICDPLHDPQGAALEYIAEHLPREFRDRSFHLQLSSSAGAPGKASIFKGHLWFFLERPYDSATLSAWAKAFDLKLDRAVFRPVQPHFTAAPVFDEGVADPVPLRSLFWRGASDIVDLTIDLDALNIRHTGARQRGERLDVSDPLADYVEQNWETWGYLADGGIIVSCPWETQHSSGVKGDTSSVYFPAGSNSYPEGGYKCLHTSCETMGRLEFAQAVGFTDHQFDALADISDLLGETPPVNGKSVTHLNGHVINDPLILPPFVRNPSGVILTNLENVVMGLKARRAAECDLAYDSFRGELLMADAASGWRYRPMTDGDAVALRIRLEQLGFQKAVSREMMRDGLSRVSDDLAFDSATQWLCDEVPPWDGVERIETFWPRYMQTLDTPYTRALGRYSWTAQAARVLEPGAKVDMVPVLVSPEGYLKSSAIGALAPSVEFFNEFNFEAKDQDLSRLMRGCLVGELSELRGISERQGEAILAWITKRDEKWTPKFKEYAVALPRRVVFYGTTNRKRFLLDHMGQRRWLPVTIQRQIDLSRIVADRLQLWAEARETWRQEGVAWREVERLAVAERPAYQAEDPLRGALARWLDTPDMGGATPRSVGEVTLLQVAEGLGIRASQLQAVVQRRLERVLGEEGFRDVLGGEDKRRVWMRD